MSLTNSVISVKPTYLGYSRSGEKPLSQVSKTIFDNFNSLIGELKKKKINILIYESPQSAVVAVYSNTNFGSLPNQKSHKKIGTTITYDQRYY